MGFNLFKSITGVGNEEKKELPTPVDMVNSLASGINSGLQKVGSGALKTYNALKTYGEQAKIAYNAQQSAGLHEIRPYIANVLKPYGYEYNETDFAFDPNTKSVTFKGYDLGASDFFDDIKNVNYYDSKRLDKVLRNTVIPGLGLYRSPQDMIGQDNEQIINRTTNLYDMITADKYDSDGRLTRAEEYAYANPLDTDLGKAIMSYFKWQGNDAAYDQAASNASDNSGNIDSFAAANAARQQLAFDKAGIGAVVDANNAQMGNILNTLFARDTIQNNKYNQLGANIDRQIYNNQRLFDNNENREQRLFNNTQTEKLNDFNMAYDTSTLMGESAPLLSQIMGYEDSNKPLYSNVMENKYLDLENKKLELAEKDASQALLAQLVPGLMSNREYFGQHVNQIINKLLGIESSSPVGQSNAGYSSGDYP